MRAWKDRMIKDPAYAAKEPYAKEARLSKFVVYSAATKKIYTPEEFLDCQEKVDIFRGKENTKQFRIIDPMAYLKYKDEELARLREEQDKLKAKISSYLADKTK
ncbi:hypothetical protein [Pedobacter gandavensis]|uniref:Uncharacterized protein n=1 Tax=Pedobacter gandavensis TaxID=2679963 RepID=A0ABR6EU45_9SPHI|nr:hypothetical protein [Pedobacter gandavensis]MBB2148787.1 hypothetical protein [Pedobacter gandavensis]